MTRRWRGSNSGSMGGQPEARAKRTALWVHLYDPHDPYEPPEPFATQFADRLYDGEVAWTDTLLGRLRAGLESRGLWDDALVVVTADHGEALGEHDETGHGFFAYETTLRVPLVMRGPGVAAGRALDGIVRLVDVAPTALDLLGLPALAGTYTGVSLASHLAASAPAITQMTYAESLTPLVHYQWSDLRVMRDGRWKYILAPRPELYDLAADPGETRDLSATETATARRLAGGARDAAQGRAREGGQHRHRRRDALGRDAAEARRARLRQPGRAEGRRRPRRRPQGQDPGVPPVERADARGARPAAPERVRAEPGPLRRVAADRRRQLPAPLLPRAGAGRDGPRPRGRAELRASGRACQPSFTQAHVGIVDIRMARRDWRGALDAVRARPAGRPERGDPVRPRGSDPRAPRRRRCRAWRPTGRW